MIVHCTSCQAKFRIADEKIGPRGAKARCSRCQTVFVVHLELGAMPLPAGAPRPTPLPAVERPSVMGGRGPLDVELEGPDRPVPPALADPFDFPPSREGAHGPGGLDPAFQHDPFAPAAQPAGEADPFGWSLPSPGPPVEAPADPFQPGMDPFAPAGASADPFASSPFGAEAPDAFAAEPGADPFDRAAPSPFPPPSDGAPVFDAEPAWSTSPEPAAAIAAAPAPFGGAAPTTARLPLTDLSDLLGDGPGPTTKPPAPPGEPAGAPPAGPDLALEDHTTPPAFRAAAFERELSLGGREPAFGGGPQDPVFGGGPELALGGEPGLGREPAFGFGSPEIELTGDHSPRPRSPPPRPAETSGALALATEPRVGARPPPLPAASGGPLAALDELVVPLADAAAVAPPARPAAPGPSRRAGSRGRSRLFALAVNAAALAALLAIALAMLVVWRGGRLEAAAFRPAAIAAALRHGAAGPFVAAEVRSGLYERERAAPLLFVRGDVVSHAPGPVRSVRVAVEVVREGTVIARGEAMAGAVPTPEELWRAPSAAALAKAARAAAERAPGRIGPGDAVPFLVALDEYPEELAGAALRISLVAEGERGR